jgi:glycosyltransferase involved in cell wall biosynthesis
MISDVYFPRVNGVSTSIATFRQSLQGLGHSTTLIAPRYPQGESGDETGVIRVDARYLFMDPEDRLMKVPAVLALAERLQQQAFDLVHIHTPFAAHYAGVRLAKKLRLPVVETYHTYFEEYFHHYMPLLPGWLTRYSARWLTRHQGRQLDALVVPSTAMLSILNDYGVEVHTEVIPTGIDLDDFTPGDSDAFRQRHGIDPQRPTLVHIGRVAHEKNIGFILEVVARVKRTLPDILLIIAGEGPARRSLQRRATELGIDGNCLFLGYFKRGQELWDCYSSGDAFVFASNTETQGLVLLEAMALGTPVVSTAVLGTRDILSAQQGCMIAEADVNDFSNKVIRLLQQPGLRQRLSAQARDYVHDWSTHTLSRRMADFYQRVVQQQRSELAVSRAPGQ